MPRNHAAVATTVAGAEPLAVAIPAATRRPKITVIARSLIHPDPEQPRTDADAELRASIAVQGLLEPIIVRPHPSIAAEWMIVNGERRWQGSEGVLNDLPCIVRTDLEDPVERLAVQLVANDGKPTPALDEAKAFYRMIEASGMNVADLAALLGRAPSTVAERLALMELGPWLPLLESGEVVMSHAVKVLIPLRRVADSAHEHAIDLMRKDYRWQNKGKGQGISVGDFERLVQQWYKPAMYPLAKTKATWAKQPEFPTTNHDAECSCGGIRFTIDGGDGERLCCGNPEWWGPLHRAAQKAAKPKGPATAAPKARGPKAPTLYLPEGTKTLKSEYGAVPKGVIALTNGRGQWCTGDHESMPFDPADLDVGALKLVQWPGGHGEAVRVGTKDADAVKAAAEKFAERVSAKVGPAEAKFTAAMERHRPRYQVSGPGATVALGYVLVEVANLDDEQRDAVDDVAATLQVTLPRDPYRVDENQKWAAKLAPGTAEELLSRLLVVLSEESVRGPASARRELVDQLAAEIAARPVPWLTEPKGAKSVAEKKPARRAKEPEFMQPMVPSAALAAVVGAEPITRVEVTKKLWAYIKRHGLQDSHNRRMLNADDVLRPVFGGKDSVSMFEMTKLVNKHLSTPALTVADKPLSDRTAELPLDDPRKPIACIHCECTEGAACTLDGEDGPEPCSWALKEPRVCTNPDCLSAEGLVEVDGGYEYEDETGPVVVDDDDEAGDADLWDAADGERAEAPALQAGKR